MKTERKVRSLKKGEEKKHLELLNLCFDKWGDEEKWRRLYHQPDFDPYENVLIVEEKGEWMGGVSMWFRRAILQQNREVKVYVAGDGCVHPNHRGKGVYSTFIQSANKHAQKKGASLGFGFISLFEVPFQALPKYGYADIFYPKTKVLALRPEKFLDYLVTQITEVSLPKKFDGMQLKLTAKFKLLQKKEDITMMFQVENGRLSEIHKPFESAGKLDLWIKADINTLLNIFDNFYFGRKGLYFKALAALLTGHLRFGFSPRFFKKMVMP